MGSIVMVEDSFVVGSTSTTPDEREAAPTQAVQATASPTRRQTTP